MAYSLKQKRICLPLPVIKPGSLLPKAATLYYYTIQAPYQPHAANFSLHMYHQVRLLLSAAKCRWLQGNLDDDGRRRTGIVWVEAAALLSLLKGRKVLQIFIFEKHYQSVICIPKVGNLQKSVSFQPKSFEHPVLVTHSRTSPATCR